MTTHASPVGEISVFAQKCVTLAPGMADLRDSDVAIVRRHAP
jgi:hypothetical protein